jgi:hypothetical protein
MPQILASGTNNAERTYGGSLLRGEGSAKEGGTLTA